MDDFREWLSDNLRYFILGFGILFILLLVFLGIRLITHRSGSSNTTAETSVTSTVETTSSTSSANAISETAETTSDGTLAVSSDASLVSLIQTYYTALSSKDVTTLKSVVNQLTTSEEEAITSATDIEAYEDVQVYAKAGPEDGTWVVYASYNCKYANYATTVPGLSQLYVCTDESGNYYISNGTIDEATQTYLDNQLSESDVTALIQSVQTSYDAALASDINLNNFINNKGEEVSDAISAADGTQLTVATTCNVREAADISSSKLGSLEEGTVVTKEGTSGEWIQITYEGQTGYVRYDMFQ